MRNSENMFLIYAERDLKLSYEAYMLQETMNVFVSGESLGSKIKSGLKKVWEKIVKFFKKIGQMIKTAWRKFTRWLGFRKKSAIERIKQFKADMKGKWWKNRYWNTKKLFGIGNQTFTNGIANGLALMLNNGGVSYTQMEEFLEIWDDSTKPMFEKIYDRVKDSKIDDGHKFIDKIKNTLTKKRIAYAFAAFHVVYGQVEALVKIISTSKNAKKDQAEALTEYLKNPGDKTREEFDNERREYFNKKQEKFKSGSNVVEEERLSKKQIDKLVAMTEEEANLLQKLTEKVWVEVERLKPLEKKMDKVIGEVAQMASKFHDLAVKIAGNIDNLDQYNRGKKGNSNQQELTRFVSGVAWTLSGLAKDLSQVAQNASMENKNEFSMGIKGVNDIGLAHANKGYEYFENIADKNAKKASDTISTEANERMTRYNA